MTNPPSRPTALAYLALAGGILALSISPMFVRWAGAPGPVTAFWRLTFASLILLPFFLPRLRRDGAQIRAALVYPLLGGVFTSIDLALWASAVTITSAANAALLGNTAPLWVALAAWLLFRQRLRPGFWIGLGATLTGAVLIMGSDFLQHPSLTLGDLMACGSAIFYAAYFISTERGRRRLDPIAYMWLVNVSAALGMWIINLLLGNDLTGYPPRSWLVFALTALVSQTGGYMVISYALGHLPAAVVAPTMVAAPALTALLAIPLLGEIPPTAQVIGGLVTLAGIYLVNQAHLRQDSA